MGKLEEVKVPVGRAVSTAGILEGEAGAWVVLARCHLDHTTPDSL